MHHQFMQIDSEQCSKDSGEMTPKRNLLVGKWIPSDSLGMGTKTTSRIETERAS